jgi:hypothetical protein
MQQHSDVIKNITRPCQTHSIERDQALSKLNATVPLDMQYNAGADSMSSTVHGF